MRHDRHHMVVGRELRDPDLHRRLGRHVEGDPRVVGQPALDPGLGQLGRRQIREDVVQRQHDLLTGVPHRRIHGAQHLVPLDDIDDRDLQRLHPHPPADPHGETDIVVQRLRIGPVDLPHLLLRKR